MAPSSETQSPSLTVICLVADFTVAVFVALVDRERAAADDAGHAHAARDHRRVAELLPPTAVRMPLATSMPWMSSGVVSLRTRITGPFADISTASSAVNARRPTAAPGEASMPVASFVSFFSAGRIEHRVQQLIELRGRDAPHRRLLVDELLVHHLHRDLHRRRTRALAVAGLQHVEHAFLHGELEILHVLVVLFEARGDLAKLADRRRAFHVFELGDRLRGADAGHHVFALRVHQELAVEDLLAACRGRA